jgi:hypothetical protein
MRAWFWPGVEYEERQEDDGVDDRWSNVGGTGRVGAAETIGCRPDQQAVACAGQVGALAGDAKDEVYDPSIPGTEVPSGTTYGSIVSEDLPAKYHQDVGSQSGIYFLRLDGATGQLTTPALVDDPRTHGGLQRFPDVSADQGTLHALWWDSRNDPCYDPTRPLGNCADKSTTASLDVFASTASEATLTWAASARVTDTTSNPNWEQFSGRTVPFGGDYLYISSVGASSFGIWTDWRDVVAGPDPREGGDGDGDGADVHQCRIQNQDGSWSRDMCPWEGGLDQNIYGDLTP